MQHVARGQPGPIRKAADGLTEVRLIKRRMPLDTATYQPSALSWQLLRPHLSTSLKSTVAHARVLRPRP